MDFRFFISFRSENIFLLLVIVSSSDWVEVVALPVGSRCFSLHDIVISSNFGIVVLSVLVGNHVVLTRHILFLILVVFTLNKKLEFIYWHLLVGLVGDVSLVAKSGALAYRCLK